MILTDRIATLDDPTALRLLTALARPHTRDPSRTTALTPDLRAALIESFGAPSEAAAPTTSGELARAALQLAAGDPALQVPLTALLNGPTPERFIEPQSFALTGAALLLLQLHVRIKRTHAGKWEILIEKPSLAAGALKPLVDKLVSFFSHPADPALPTGRTRKTAPKPLRSAPNHQITGTMPHSRITRSAVTTVIPRERAVATMIRSAGSP